MDLSLWWLLTFVCIETWARVAEEACLRRFEAIYNTTDVVCVTKYPGDGHWLKQRGRNSPLRQVHRHRQVTCRVGGSESKPTSVLHIGAFDSNVGDNLALDHVQQHVAAALGGVTQFHLADIMYYFHSQKNSVIDFKQIISHLVAEYDVRLIVFGGGGLVQPGYDAFETHWRLPLNEEIMQWLVVVGVQVVVYGVGLNHFRGGLEDYGTAARASFRAAIVGSMAFSVRNDGSKAILDSIFADEPEVAERVFEIADPGMLLPPSRCALVRDSVDAINATSPGALQPAWNSGSKINEGRFPKTVAHPDPIRDLANVVDAYSLVILPHTPTKDFELTKQFRITTNVSQPASLFEIIDVDVYRHVSSSRNETSKASSSLSTMLSCLKLSMNHHPAFHMILRCVDMVCTCAWR